jgi:hypothetical protein
MIIWSSLSLTIYIDKLECFSLPTSFYNWVEYSGVRLVLTHMEHLGILSQNLLRP